LLSRLLLSTARRPASSIEWLISSPTIWPLWWRAICRATPAVSVHTSSTRFPGRRAICETKNPRQRRYWKKVNACAQVPYKWAIPSNRSWAKTVVLSSDGEADAFLRATGTEVTKRPRYERFF
jgi:hypothetical protein